MNYISNYVEKAMVIRNRLFAIERIKLFSRLFVVSKHTMCRSIKIKIGVIIKETLLWKEKKK